MEKVPNSVLPLLQDILLVFSVRLFLTLLILSFLSWLLREILKEVLVRKSVLLLRSLDSRDSGLD